MKSKNCCIILTTIGSKENTNLITKILLKAKLVSCVQVDKIESFFTMRQGVGKRINFG